MSPVELCPGIELVDLALWMPKEKVLAVSDFHIGYEEALNTAGIFIPRHQLEDTKERLKRIFSALKTKPKKIIITGDLKYEFGTVNREEFFGLRELLVFLKNRCEKVIALKGNHDKILHFVDKKIEVKSTVRLGDVLFCHGDSLINNTKAKIIVVGHAHPAVKLSDGITSEKVKCFVKGKWKGRTLIVLPSFNLVTEGSDILSESVLSPYISSAKRLEAWAVSEAGEILYFGKLRNLTFG